MPSPQPGIFALGTRSHVHLELDVHPSATPEAVVAAFAGLREPAVTAGGANLVVGFGDDLWRQLADASDVPTDLTGFRAIDGIDDKSAPATQHDIWVWVHGTGEDVTFDVARAVVAALAPVARVAAESRGFVFKDSRDLTGFIDGTANRPVDEAVTIAVVPEGQPGAGGSLAMVQHWIHDLGAFHAQSQADQERVIGRTKPDSVQLRGDAMPANSHVSRADVSDADGNELSVWRRSVPFGTLAEHGLIFVSFSADLARVQTMLDRMYGLADDGVRDALLDYTQAISGAFYFCPDAATLAGLGA
jgi:putative iron-dependent peroxidase